MTTQQKHCRTRQVRASSSYRPSWFVVVGFLAVALGVLRVAAGAPAIDLLFPALALCVGLLVDWPEGRQ